MLSSFLFKKFAQEVKTKLRPHQQRVVERITSPDQPGLVVAHGTGSGKSLASIAAQEALGMRSTIVTPAALQANYMKELKKHTTGKLKANLVSLETAARRGTIPDAPLLTVDEAHRLREVSTKAHKALKSAKSQKRLLLTGSPFYNRPSDIAPLINIAAGKKVMPESPEEFESKYIRHRTIRPGFIQRLQGVKPGVVSSLNPAREEELRSTFGKWVDYYPSPSEDFPDVSRQNLKVPMTRRQVHFYDAIMKGAPPWVRHKVLSGLPPSKREARELNAFLSGGRQAAGSTAPFHELGTADEPKIDLAFRELSKNLSSNPRSKAVVYSTFLEAGVDPYKRKLEQAGIPYGEITGRMKKKQREELVKQYNRGDIKTLLLSSAGGEGLDLKGTRLVQVLEPHWNEEKLKQVEGRAIRYRSHSNLPEGERNVHIQRFLSTRPPTGILERLKLKKPGGAVDEYLANLSKQKEQVIQQFRSLLQEQRQEQYG